MAFSVVFVVVALVVVAALVSALAARWSSARARRQMTAFLARVAALPSIDTKSGTGRDADTMLPSRPSTEARLYFLDAYRAARTETRSTRLARTRRTVPTLSLEHPSPARGA
ncbi:MAG: hypothetical protein QOJ71_1251 [Actinomycetota bacterium]|jgi:hypothetical protein|nr:hypothetical protein [Actinomycetota bacterium]